MALIGFLLLAASAVAAGGFLYDGRDVAADGHIFGQTIGGLTQTGLFAIGLGLGVLATISLFMMFSGVSRRRTQRSTRVVEERRLASERDELARRAKLEAETAYSLREERDQLAAQLEEERVGKTSTATKNGKVGAHRS